MLADAALPGLFVLFELPAGTCKFGLAGTCDGTTRDGVGTGGVTGAGGGGITTVIGGTTGIWPASTTTQGKVTNKDSATRANIRVTERDMVEFFAGESIRKDLQ
jgi:hypothetical protein